MSKLSLFSRSFAVATLSIVSAIPLAAQKPVLAPTPPMGWNSWDSYGLTITEDQFKANVEVEAARLKAAGYSYAVVDEGWYLGNPEAADKHPETLNYRMDANGRYQPSLNRFSTAAGDEGFAPLAKFVHAKGLKFGIHIIRGVPKGALKANLSVAGSGYRISDLADTSDTCPWNPDNFGVKNNAAGQAWYDSMFKQYAAWGVDYVKVDCIASHPYKADEIAMIHNAIGKTGRPIILSLSPGPAPLENAVAFGEKAQLWRISNDVWDIWSGARGQDDFPQNVKAQFAVIDSWRKYVKPGNWPDADMLPLGTLGPIPGWGEPRETRLTHDEQRTLITLWCIAREPLFFGGNLTKLDDWTASLLTNPEVIAMDQHGHDQHLAATDGEVVAWTSKGAAGAEYLAIFNRADEPAPVNSSFDHYGLTGGYSYKDLWDGTHHSVTETINAVIPAHGTLLLHLTPSATKAPLQLCGVEISPKLLPYYAEVRQFFSEGIECLVVPAENPNAHPTPISLSNKTKWTILIGDPNQRYMGLMLGHELLHGWLVTKGFDLKDRDPQNSYKLLEIAIQHKVIRREEAKLGISESVLAETDLASFEGQIEAARLTGQQTFIASNSLVLMDIWNRDPEVGVKANAWLHQRSGGQETIDLTRMIDVDWNGRPLDTQASVAEAAQFAISAINRFQGKASYAPKL